MCVVAACIPNSVQLIGHAANSVLLILQKGGGMIALVYIFIQSVCFRHHVCVTPAGAHQ
jgi:hypothetical protein